MENKTIFTKSKTISVEYCCSIVKVDNITDVPDSDFLCQTIINGRTMVVNKEFIKMGDIVFYISNECCINLGFLKENNMFRDASLNKNKEKQGYIEQNGRIKMIKLRGIYSMGLIINANELRKYCPSIPLDLEPYIGEDFDTLDGKLFVKPYFPEKYNNGSQGNGKRRNKLLQKYVNKKQSKIILGQFSYHYDTKLFEKDIKSFKPDDFVYISVKLHGTSFILSNTLVNIPLYTGFYTKIFNYLPNFLQYTMQVYEPIYSSRNVIRNGMINEVDNTPDNNVYKTYYLKLKDYIPERYTIYGEIIGYFPESTKQIQNNFDYGCTTGESKLMIYRITVTEKDGKKTELDIQDVIEFSNALSEKISCIAPYPLLYKGTLYNLYPELDVATHWHENFIEKLKTDARFNMERPEPLCKGVVPREGLVIRLKDNIVSEAWKLKTLSFLAREAKQIDKGIVDTEMNDTISE